MAILTIVEYPAPILRTRCKAVTEVNDAIRGMLDDLAETMYAAPGVGLAAPQVGSDLRLVVMDVGPERERGRHLLQMVNPHIVARAGNKIVGQEGCLSFPEIYEDVVRYDQVRVSYLDRHGQAQQLDASGFLAVAIQHELDHLEGVVFIDYLSRIRRGLIERKMQKRATRRKKEADQHQSKNAGDSADQMHA